MKTRNFIIEKLVKKYPEFKGKLAPSENFNGSEGGIWFKIGFYNIAFEGELLSLPLINDDYSVTQEIESLLNKYNWQGQPYDNGTLLAYC